MTSIAASLRSKPAFREALQLHQTDAFDEAIARYEALLAESPNDEVLHLLAIAYAQTQQYDKALAACQQALVLDPDNSHFLATLGNLHRHLGQFPQAIAALQKALSNETTHVTAQHNLGLVYYQQDQIDQAMGCFQDLLSRLPSHAEAYYNLALCHIRKSQIGQAKKALSQASDYAPRHPRALYQLAQIYHEEQAYGQARTLYEKHLDNFPSHAEALLNYAAILLHFQQDQEAFSCLQKAHDIDPELEDLHHNLASVFLHRRDYQSALKHWLQHYKRSPDRDTLYNIGVTYSYLGRYEEASDYLFGVLKEDPEHYPTLVNLGAVFLQANKRDLAQTYYEKAQTIQPSPTIAFVLDALTGRQQSSHPPQEYVVDLFDQYAAYYDQHLLNSLHYRVPDAMAKCIRDSLNPRPDSLFCIDIGCGTGLCAERISAFCHRLVGVDLASNMVELARKKKVFTTLHCADVCTTLAQYHGCDLVIAGDLLPYFGDLTPLFTAVSQVLKPGGSWFFSFETTHNSDYHLGASARFMHDPNYIKKLATEWGFTVLDSQNVALRTQQQVFVSGHIFALQKQTD